MTVLGEQNSSLSTIKKSIRDSIISIEKKCEDLELDKRHSEIKTSNFIERFRELSESVINELDEIKSKKLTNNIDEDAILTELTKLFSVSKGNLGSPPKDQKVLEDIYKDGEFRAKNKIPPSFEDILEAQKNKSNEEYYAFEGLHYKKGYGDLIVWKQIIEFAQENQRKNIIFVTDDTKEDWMRIINSHGKKTISARPELVSEIFKEAGVENFYIYDTNGFLEYSKKYLKTDIQDKTIEDVRKSYYKNHNIYVEKIQRTSESENQEIIESWLMKKYSFIQESGRLFNYQYIAFEGFDAGTPVYLRFLDSEISSHLEILEMLSHIALLLKGELPYEELEGKLAYEGFHIILVVSELEHFFQDSNHIYRNMRKEFRNYMATILDNENLKLFLHLNIVVTLGYINDYSKDFVTLEEFKVNN